MCLRVWIQGTFHLNPGSPLFKKTSDLNPALLISLRELGQRLQISKFWYIYIYIYIYICNKDDFSYKTSFQKFFICLVFYLNYKSISKPVKFLVGVLDSNVWFIPFLILGQWPKTKNQLSYSGKIQIFLQKIPYFRE